MLSLLSFLPCLFSLIGKWFLVDWPSVFENRNLQSCSVSGILSLVGEGCDLHWEGIMNSILSDMPFWCAVATWGTATSLQDYSPHLCLCSFKHMHMSLLPNVQVAPNSVCRVITEGPLTLSPILNISLNCSTFTITFSRTEFWFSLVFFFSVDLNPCAFYILGIL